MKKVLITLCGIFMITNAFASEKPNKTSVDGATYWKVGGSYSVDVSGTGDNDYSKFTPKYQLESRYGTFGNTANGSIVAVVANRIYENGGVFCTTQIQAGNNYYTLWIDYYKTSGYKCFTICKPGYYGDDCSSTEADKCDKDTDFTKIFDKSQYDMRIGTGKTKGRFTKEMDVFSYDEPGTAKEKENVVLGVIKRLKHGVIVAPVKIVGRRNGNFLDIDTRIMSTRSNGSNTLLCAAGYKANTDKTDCVEGVSLCETNSQIEWCPGYNGTEYNSEQHGWKKQGSCKVYYCKLAGYGFKSATDRTCELCGTDLRSGASRSTGTCTTCPIGQCFTDGECGNCKYTISKLQMARGYKYDETDKECWRETDPKKFGGCVMCNVENQCWINHKCQQCPSN